MHGKVSEETAVIVIAAKVAVKLREYVFLIYSSMGEHSLFWRVSISYSDLWLIASSGFPSVIIPTGRALGETDINEKKQLISS